MTRFADLIRAAGLSLALTAACVGCQSEAPTPAPSIALTPSGTTSPWATPAAESDKRLFNDILQRFLIVEQDAYRAPRGTWEKFREITTPEFYSSLQALRNTLIESGIKSSGKVQRFKLKISDVEEKYGHFFVIASYCENYSEAPFIDIDSDEPVEGPPRKPRYVRLELRKMPDKTWKAASQYDKKLEECSPD